MTADFETQLTALLDDVAGSITPRADFGAVREAAGGTGGIATIRTAGGAPRPFRRGAAAAAAAVLVVTGGAAALEYASDDSGSVATTPEVTEPEALEPPAEIDEADDIDEPDDVVAIGDGDVTDDKTGDADDAAVSDKADAKDDDSASDPAHTAKLGLSKLDHEPPVQWFHGRAPAGEIVTVSSEFGVVVTEAGESGEWKTAVEFAGAEGGAEIAVSVSFAGLDEVVDFVLEVPVDEPVKEEEPDDSPKDDEVDKPAEDEEPPKEDEPAEPAAVAFTAVLGWSEPQSWGVKIGLWGAATPGSVIELGSDYGTGRAVANDKGEWQMIAELELPAGAKTVVVVEASSSDRGFEFLVERPAEAPAEHAFSAALGASFLDHEPPEQWFFGTGQPGSAVIATSPYGSADAEVFENGEYELKLVLGDAPAGAVVPVQVTNTASDKTFSFELKVPAEEAASVEFSANAEFVECDSTPPYNVYFGTAQPGSAIVVSSPYGSGEKTVGESGGWELLVEFPTAPIGETFVVSVKSVATGQVKEFPMKAVAPEGEGGGGEHGG